MTNNQTLTGSLKEQAGYWIVRQNSGNWSAKDEQAFRQWLAKSAEHRQAFEQVKDLWQGLDQFKLTARQPQAPDKRRPNVVRPNRWRSAAVWAVAASIGFLALKMDVTYLIPSDTTYATIKGQQLSITLADGSQIALNTDTELKVELGPLRRSITLNRGEASFNVAHEALRSFVVTVGSGRIIDIGTRFNVYQSPEQVDITVMEGDVRVETKQQSSPPLSAGQRLHYNADGALSVPDRPDLAALTAWQHGQMVFDMAPLNQVTAQLARYHGVKFIFDDPRLKQLKMSGTFKTNNLPLFLATLESIYPLRAIMVTDQTVHLKAAARR